MSDIRRQIAYKCSIEQLLNAKYILQQGLNPNYLAFCGLNVSRVNLIAVVVFKEGNSLTLDDGSGQIQVMLFEERLKNKKFNLGDLLLVIGRPREYDAKRFLVPEIIKWLNNNKWLDFRREELNFLNYCKLPKISSVKSASDVNESSFNVVENYQEKILSKISELDKGDGASYQELVNSLNMGCAKDKIRELIEEGEIFEVKGKLRIL